MNYHIMKLSNQKINNKGLFNINRYSVHLINNKIKIQNLDQVQSEQKKKLKHIYWPILIPKIQIF